MSAQSLHHSEFVRGKLSKWQSIGWDKAEVLHDGPRKLVLVVAKHVDHKSGERGVCLQFIQYSRQKLADPLEEHAKITVDEKGFAGLLEYLERQTALAKLPLGSRYVAVKTGATAACISDQDARSAAEVLEALITQGELSRLSSEGVLPDETVRHIGVATQHLRHRMALDELRRLLAAETAEQAYQAWLEQHPWVFGTQYIERVPKRRIGLEDITDIILRTTDGYCDLLEVKRPNMEVLKNNPSRSLWYFAPDSALGVAQCAKYIKKTEEYRYTLAQERGLTFLKPRARLIIGRSEDWTQDQRDALRVLNGSLHFVEVWTYDQVLAMGEQLLRLYEDSSALSPPENAASEHTYAMDDDFFGD